MTTPEDALPALLDDLAHQASLNNEYDNRGALDRAKAKALSALTALQQERDELRAALESIALAGMSGSGQESEEGMRDWHARRAWDFIAIAARALAPKATQEVKARESWSHASSAEPFAGPFERWGTTPGRATSCRPKTATTTTRWATFGSTSAMAGT